MTVALAMTAPQKRAEALAGGAGRGSPLKFILKRTQTRTNTQKRTEQHKNAQKTLKRTETHRNEQGFRSFIAPPKAHLGPFLPLHPAPPLPFLPRRRSISRLKRGLVLSGRYLGYKSLVGGMAYSRGEMDGHTLTGCWWPSGCTASNGRCVGGPAVALDNWVGVSCMSRFVERGFPDPPLPLHRGQVHSFLQRSRVATPTSAGVPHWTFLTVHHWPWTAERADWKPLVSGLLGDR